MVDYIPREPTACPSPRITLDDTGADLKEREDQNKGEEGLSSRRRRCALDSARATYREGEIVVPTRSRILLYR